MLLAPFLWIFCEFDEKVLDNLSLVGRVRIFYFYRKCSILTSTPAPRYLNGAQVLFSLLICKIPT